MTSSPSLRRYNRREIRDIMGDVSMIARRKIDGTVECGWSGNWGSYSSVGETLMDWYNDNNYLVDHLFSLGQLSNLDAPFSETDETKSVYYKTNPTGTPHWVSDSERDIVTKIAFVDYIYFFEESDEGWYYIAPGQFCFKLPLNLVGNNVDEQGNEYKFLDKVKQKVLDYLLTEYPKTDPGFAAILDGYDLDELREELGTEYPFYVLCRQYRDIYNYMDHWVVIVPDAEEKEIAGILMRKREEPRIETINWPGHPTHKKEAYVNPVIINYALSYVVGVLKGLLKAINDPTSKMPDFDIPAGILVKFRNEGDDAAIELLRENFTDLHGASQYFDSFMAEGLNRGRKFYQAYVDKQINKEKAI